ncbi:hypothetical protein RXV86_09785 [Alisedimentitalea sp. MJ-SS2]|uniref:hypothetical protein n=1 Tax=Aliisedimentitalea sp. MJ-SS2 TaxID=3049795 RepID=UPI002914EECD|nr:hypothetical protein [Alisedimentitalea sp. MJ-SS2]MDU8927674.1 hypothetical protein [Alisedimentitalea sp. MJ-SS2]
MFTSQIFTEECREELIDFASKIEVKALTGPKMPDRYLAMSLLQKAVRRGELGYAWEAARYLLIERPETLWKRLAVIALEDIGVADMPTVMKILLVCTDVELRHRLGGAEKSAFTCVELLCVSSKDRASDDLYDVLTRDHGVREMKAAFPESPRLNAEEANLNGIVQSALTLLSHAGELDLDNAYVRSTKVWANAVVRFSDGLVSPLVQDAAILGLRKTRLVLGPLLTALAPLRPENLSLIDDPVLPHQTICGFPSWALGMHTRVGLEGFRRFLQRSDRLRELFADATTGETSKPRTVGGLVFRLDCGVLRNRIDWSVGRGLQKWATRMGWGLADEAVLPALDLIREEWDLVNDCRREALINYLR